jgi:hypothetical protein
MSFPPQPKAISRLQLGFSSVVLLPPAAPLVLNPFFDQADGKTDWPYRSHNQSARGVPEVAERPTVAHKFGEAEAWLLLALIAHPPENDQECKERVEAVKCYADDDGYLGAQRKQPWCAAHQRTRTVPLPEWPLKPLARFMAGGMYAVSSGPVGKESVLGTSQRLWIG